MKIVFATGNKGKLREASEILGKGFELEDLHAVGIYEDVPETGATLMANSLQKAEYVFDKCGCDCFADDTIFARTAVAPIRSISAPTPLHRQIDPARENASVMPACAPWGIAAAKALPFPVSKAKTTDISKMKNQI